MKILVLYSETRKIRTQNSGFKKKLVCLQTLFSIHYLLYFINIYSNVKTYYFCRSFQQVNRIGLIVGWQSVVPILLNLDCDDKSYKTCVLYIGNEFTNNFQKRKYMQKSWWIMHWRSYFNQWRSQKIVFQNSRGVN